jgi:hypothetical protein
MAFFNMTLQECDISSPWRAPGAQPRMSAGLLAAAKRTRPTISAFMYALFHELLIEEALKRLPL